MITARHEGVPLVAVTAQHRLDIVYPSPPSIFQGQDQLDVFAAAVKWGAPILSWGRIPEVTRMAFREMWTGRPGPVQLEIPSPVMYETGDEAAVRVLPPGAYRAGSPQPSEAQLEQAAELLAAAEHPVVVAGSGVDRAAANDPARQQLVQIDLDPRHLGVTRPLALGIVADARSALEGLVRVLEKRGVRRRAREDLDRYRAADRAWRDEQFGGVEGWSGAGLHPARAMQAIGRAFGREAIYVTDGGNTSLWAHWFLPPTRPRSYLNILGSYLNILELGMLGTGIPSALGAVLVNPERRVVCVTGDGAAGFNFMEMQSAAREGLPLTTIVFAEGSWTMEEPNERMRYGRTFGTDQGTIRWDVVGEGLGCRGLYVEEPDALDDVLAHAVATDGPVVVCLRTDRTANLATPPDPLLRFVEVYQGPMG